MRREKELLTNIEMSGTNQFFGPRERPTGQKGQNSMKNNLLLVSSQEDGHDLIQVGFFAEYSKIQFWQPLAIIIHDAALSIN